MSEDEVYMHRCLQLAAIGLGKVQPNPMVGAVLVADCRIIGEGYHQQYGQNHAEINAIDNVKDFSSLQRCTLYVSLEPCSHYGKTPPCADAIIRHGIPKVVVGTIDSHDKVNGNGLRKLKAAGIEVVQGVCETECRELNRRFFTYHCRRRPYIILKWAQTRDGFMDIERPAGMPVQSYWITNPALRVIVHKWRSEEDAVLVGYNTMQNDCPQLTTRYYPGKNPKPFVMLHSAEAYSLNSSATPFPMNIEEGLSMMYERRIQSVIVEGGRKTLDRFIESGYWDEARILVGSQSWGKGLPAPSIPIAPHHIENIDDNIILYVRRHL